MSKCDTSNAVLNDRSPRLESTSTLCRIFLTHFWHIKCCSQWQVAKSGINQMKFWTFISLTALHAEWNGKKEFNLRKIKNEKCMQACQTGDGSEPLFDWLAKCQLLIWIQIAHFCPFFGSPEFPSPLPLVLMWILAKETWRWFILKKDRNISIILHEKKSWCLLSKDGEIETPKPCRVFFEKEEVVVVFFGTFNLSYPSKQ